MPDVVRFNSRRIQLFQDRSDPFREIGRRSVIRNDQTKITAVLPQVSQQRQPQGWRIVVGRDDDRSRRQQKFTFRFGEQGQWFRPADDSGIQGEPKRGGTISRYDPRDDNLTGRGRRTLGTGQRNHLPAQAADYRFMA